MNLEQRMDYQASTVLHLVQAMDVPGVLLVGPPGTAKVGIARRICERLPALSAYQVQQLTWIYDGANLQRPLRGTPDGRTVISPPLRAPHHSVSMAGIIGTSAASAGMFIPGEAHLAFGGMLLLDEMPEFQPSVLDALGRVMGLRIPAPVAPAIIVGTALPCPCGYLGHPVRSCECSDQARHRWWERMRECIAALTPLVVTLGISTTK